MKEQLIEILGLRKKESIRLMILFSFILLIFEFFGWQEPFHRLAGQFGWNYHLDQNTAQFAAQAWTSLNFLILFVLFPVIYHYFYPIEDSVSYGVKLPKKESSNKLYFLLAAIMVPIVFIASTSPQFYKFYPLYRPQGFSDWLAFEVVYMLQFFCVEFFFRGFGIFRLKSLIGEHAVAVMVVPYALIHIHKPFPEAIGSIFAGIVLGHLSLKGESIWPGVALHVLIAICADTFGLYHSGWFN